MKIGLFHRHLGMHSLIKSINIKKIFNSVATHLGNDDYKINEDLLIKLLPKDFLPVSPDKILLTVDDSEGCGTGQRNLNRFRNWAKYFDCYCLAIYKPTKKNKIS